MEMDIKKEKVCINKLIAEKQEIVFVEEDMIVPDSKPDILNTINLCGNVCIYKKEVLDGKIRIDGCINTYIMYLPGSEEDRVRGLNTSIDFSKTIQIPEAKEGMDANICVDIKSIECKVLNERKINIRASLDMKIKIYSNEDVEIVNKIDCGNDVQELKETFNINSLIGRSSTKVYVKDTININESDEIAEILKANVELVDNDIKISYNKILAKCEVSVKIMYLTEDNRINKIETKIPAVGFIDLQNIAEDNICDINNQINNIVIKPNQADEHSIYIEVEIETSVSAFERKEIALIQDVYSPCMNLGFTQRKITTQSNRIEQNKQFTITSKTNIPEMQNSEILDTQIMTNINKEQVRENAINYEGEMTVNFIFLNENNSINSMVSKIPFTFEIDNQTGSEKVDVDTKIMPVNADFKANSNGDIDCKIDMEVFSNILQNANMNIIDNVEVQENEEQTGDEYDSLIIYIVQKGDTLWKIAKKFRSTIDDIAKTNGIENTNKIDIGQKLYIPKFNYFRRNNLDAVSA